MTRQFTGRHMLAILIAFFGTVIAVNMVMAVLATRTFGGLVVENSYVATRQFNGWLEQAPSVRLVKTSRAPRIRRMSSHGHQNRRVPKPPGHATAAPKAVRAWASCAGGHGLGT